MSNGFTNLFGTRNNQPSGSSGPVSFFLSAKNPPAEHPQPPMATPPPATPTPAETPNPSQPPAPAPEAAAPTSFFSRPPSRPSDPPAPIPENTPAPAPQQTRYFGNQAAQVVNKPGFVPLVGTHGPPPAASGGFFGSAAGKSGGGLFFNFVNDKKKPEEQSKTETNTDQGSKDKLIEDLAQLKPVELKNNPRVSGVFDNLVQQQPTIHDSTVEGQRLNTDTAEKQNDGLSTPPRRPSLKERGSEQSSKSRRKNSEAVDFMKALQQIDNDLGTINGVVLANPIIGIVQTQDKGKESPPSKRVYFDEEAISMSNKKESESRQNRAAIVNLPSPSQRLPTETIPKQDGGPTLKTSYSFFAKDSPKEEQPLPKTMSASDPTQENRQITDPTLATQDTQATKEDTNPAPAPKLPPIFSANTPSTTPATPIPAQSRLPPTTFVPQTGPLSALPKPGAARTSAAPKEQLAEQKQAFATLLQRARNTLARNRDGRTVREEAYVQARASLGKIPQFAEKVVALQALASRDIEFVNQVEEFMQRGVVSGVEDKALAQTKIKIAELEAGLESTEKYVQHLKLIKSSLENELQLSSESKLDTKVRVLQELMEPRKYAPTTLSTYSFGGLLGSDKISGRGFTKQPQNSLFTSSSLIQSQNSTTDNKMQLSNSTSHFATLPSKQTTWVLNTLNQLANTTESTLQSFETPRPPPQPQRPLTSAFKRNLQKQWHSPATQQPHPAN